MNKKTIMFSLVFSFTLLSVSSFLTAMTGPGMPGPGAIGGPGAMPGMPGAPGGMPFDPSQMTPEQIAEMEKQLEAEIDAFVATLPPEEQEQFHKDVEELTEMMNNMSEEELMQFIDDVVTQEEEMQKQMSPEMKQPQKPVMKPMQKPQPAPKPTPQEPAPKPQAPKIKSAQLEKALIQTIENIIKQTSDFLLKAQSIPDFDAKVQKWGNNDLLPGWKVSFNWQKLKEQVELLNVRLYLLKDKDPVTSETKHLRDLVERKNVLRQLESFERNLQKYVPRITVGDFGLEKMSKQSSKALQKATAAISKNLLSKDILVELDKVINKYEGLAKKLRQEEEKARKKAESTARRAPRQTRTVVAGKRSPVQRGSRPGPSAYATSFGDPGARPTHSFTPSAPSKPTAQAPTTPTPAKGAGKTRTTGAAKPAAKKPASPKEETKESRTMKRKMNEIADDMKAAKEALVAGANPLREFSKYILKPGIPLDTDIAVNQLPTAIRKIRTTIDELNALNKQVKRLKKNEQKSYKQEIKSIWEEHDKVFGDTEAQIAQAIANIDKIEPEKQYAFFGGKNRQSLSDNEQTKKVVEMVPFPRSIVDLQSNLQELRRAVQPLIK